MNDFLTISNQSTRLVKSRTINPNSLSLKSKFNICKITITYCAWKWFFIETETPEIIKSSSFCQITFYNTFNFMNKIILLFFNLTAGHLNPLTQIPHWSWFIVSSLLSLGYMLGMCGCFRHMQYCTSTPPLCSLCHFLSDLFSFPCLIWALKCKSTCHWCTRNVTCCLFQIRHWVLRYHCCTASALLFHSAGPQRKTNTGSTFGWHRFVWLNKTVTTGDVLFFLNPARGT